MGQCLAKIGHSCGTRSGLQVFAGEDGTLNGYCFACGKYVRHPYGEPKRTEELPQPKVKTPEEIEEELKEISTYQFLPLEHKKLSAEALKEFGVRVSVNEEDGKTPQEVFYPYEKDGIIVGYKVKAIKPDENGKKVMWSIGELKGAEFFGWSRARAIGAKRIIITEGEDDAIALTRILDRHGDDKWKDYTAVISLPHGAASAARDVGRIRETLKTKDVVLAFDMDKAGRKAEEEVMLVLPNAKAAHLPAKDANDCILEGKTKAAYKAVMMEASTPKNTRLVFGEDLHIEAREPTPYGELTWPWKHLNDATRGIRYGETIYIGAGVKMGKSGVLNELAAHFIEEHNIPVFMAKPEEANKKTYKLLAGKLARSVFHDPDKEFDYAKYDEAGAILRNKLAMVNLYQHLGWESLKADIVSAVSWGAKAIFIDPITNLVNGIEAGDANTKLQEIAQDLAAMALDFNIVIFIFCHLKAPEGNITKEKREKFYHDGKFIGLGNCPHEMGGDIYSSQFAGSRAMMRSCHMMLGLEGNKDDDLDREVRNLRDLVLLEDREFGETGRFHLYWNPNTTRFEEL